MTENKEPLHISERPQDFNEIIGNSALVKALQKELAKPSKAHTFLLTGPSGCGKTTIARIISKELECDIHSGLIEVNAANTRGIDDMRELIKEAQFRPQSGKVKVIIIDEVHQLTKEAQNSLLKPLEEPPEFMYYFLCTTDPQKILKTIKTRCQHYEVQILTDREIKTLLLKTSMKYDFDIPADVIEKIIEVSDGSARLALQGLQKVSEMSEPEEMLKALYTISTESAEVKELCQLIAKGGSWKDASGLIKAIKEEPEAVRRAVLGYLAACLLNSGDSKFFKKADPFRENFFDEGKAGLTLAVFEAMHRS